ncbi:MAG: hypothetical protein DBY16_08725 [Coprobacter sp.]|jgi:lipoprotein|nr:hypothetical protein [Barnesiella sp. GGCC_0306]PWM89883.1 MAG: hypothetical protein DBY16_08725 [Coprobacter sp.]
MKTYIKTLFFVMIGLFALSCNNKLSKETSYVLYYEPDSSHVTEKRMIGDSIVIKKISQDSILISTHISNMTVYENLYFRIGNNLWEKRHRSNDFGEFLKIDSIPTFFLNDTSFIYKSAREIFPVVRIYSYADCRYIIKKQGEKYVTVKQSTIDTTYKEIFFYDKDFNIHKYINTYKDNYCVYIRKE